MKEKKHRVDFCVVGGGLSGMCAAIAAARRGARVALVHDRPVLGGNASSEIRMWVCGARGRNNRETGLIEEMMLDNLYRNPTGNYSIWDSVLYEKVRFQENLTLLMNCSCCRADTDAGRIRSVTGWQLTTETWHTVEADLFADCSGDGILAPLAGAEFRLGREARHEFGESIEPETADLKTMGMSCLIQARETDRPQPFIAPDWANYYESVEDLPCRGWDVRKTNFWWIELGGEEDSIHDTEDLRDELLKVAFGVWDTIKNRSDQHVENWELEWVGFLPGKRESRRLVGDHVLTQHDVEAEGRFDDLVAYGGWPMDDHHPGGVRHPGKPTIFHPAPSPFGIPYRCLYSRNIENLFFAGRNISCTHAGMSSTRVMATCSTMGQAVGTAAALAVRDGLTPRGVYEEKIAELKQTLLEDDAYLPWNRREIPALTRNAALEAAEGDPEPLRNGVDRPVDDTDNGWSGSPGAAVTMTFDKPTEIREIRLVFDSDLNADKNVFKMPCRYPLDAPPRRPPETLVRAFFIDTLPTDGSSTTLLKTLHDAQRLGQVPGTACAAAVRFVPEKTWGAERVHVFAWDVR